MPTTPVSIWSILGHDDGAIVDPSAPPVTLGDLKTWLRYPNPQQPGDDDALLTQILWGAWQYMETAAGPIMPTTYTERFDGWAGDTIMLRHEPCISVSYVYEFWSTGGLHVLSESTPEDSIDGYQLDYETGEMIRVFQGNWPRTYFPGSQNVEVQYVAGFDPLPSTACEALVELAVHRWQTEIQSRAMGFGGGVPMDDDDQPAGPAAGKWIGVPNKVIDKLNQLRTPVLGCD